MLGNVLNFENGTQRVFIFKEIKRYESVAWEVPVGSTEQNSNWEIHLLECKKIVQTLKGRVQLKADADKLLTLERMWERLIPPEIQGSDA